MVSLIHSFVDTRASMINAGWFRYMVIPMTLSREGMATTGWFHCGFPIRNNHLFVTGWLGTYSPVSNHGSNGYDRRDSTYCSTPNCRCPTENYNLGPLGTWCICLPQMIAGQKKCAQSTWRLYWLFIPTIDLSLGLVWSGHIYTLSQSRGSPVRSVRRKTNEKRKGTTT